MPNYLQCFILSVSMKGNQGTFYRHRFLNLKDVISSKIQQKFQSLIEYSICFSLYYMHFNIIHTIIFFLIYLTDKYVNVTKSKSKAKDNEPGTTSKYPPTVLTTDTNIITFRPF